MVLIGNSGANSMVATNSSIRSSAAGQRHDPRRRRQRLAGRRDGNDSLRRRAWDDLYRIAAVADLGAGDRIYDSAAASTYCASSR